MTRNLIALVLFATLAVPAVSFANEVIDFQGRKMVLLNETTVTEIEAVLATDSAQLTDAQKIEKIEAALLVDAKAADGFCATAAATYSVPGDRPTPERVTDACNEVFKDPALGEQIVSGELMAQLPAGTSLRHGLSQVISAFTMMFANL